MNSFIKCECGCYNPKDSKYCVCCGKALKQKGSIVAVFDDPQRGFVLLKHLKKTSLEVKGFKPSNLTFSDLGEVDFVVLDIDPKFRELSVLLRRISENLSRSKLIAISKKGYFAIWDKLGVDIVAEKPSDVVEIIKKEFAYSDLPIYTMKEAEAFLKHFSDYNVIFVKFNRFDDAKIFNLHHLLVGLYYSLKRSDIFMVVPNAYVAIIPSNQKDGRGVKILKEKVEVYIKEHLTSDDISLNSVEIVQLKNNKKEISSQKEIIVAKEYSRQESSEDKAKGSHKSEPVFAILKAFRSQLGKLYFTSLRKKVEPYLTLGDAKWIAENRNYSDKEEIERLTEEFTQLEKQSKILKYTEEEFLSSLDGNVEILSLPEVQSNIIMLINRDASFNRIVREIKKDPAISAKILKLANSAFFGLKGKVKSVEKAAVVLGSQEIMSISLSVSCLNKFSSPFIKDLYKYAIATYAIATFLEDKLQVVTSAPLTAILHSIGYMFYAQYMKDEFSEVVNRAKNGGVFESEAVDVLPARAQEVSYKLATMWNIPQRVAQIIRDFLYPKRSSSFDASIYVLHTSVLFARILGYMWGSYSIDDISYHAYKVFLDRFGINIVKFFKEHHEELKEKSSNMVAVLA
ncbi:HDOD domain-containing protein [Hippea jasoniae]|uniref:HDOD domain-containing protein n=1 Tax=Hippea jasoniae TaxID=944479 RepID=UPI0005582815|nr:HDOD domain-containing protein [Hippea jasoniae]